MFAKDRSGTTIVLAALVLLCACGEEAKEGVQEESGISTDPLQASVDLSPSQLDAIKVEPVGTYLFTVEKEAVGSISFDEDLALIQAESALVGAAATFELTGKTLARARDLYGMNGGLAQRELEQALSDHQTAEAALRSARDAVRALGKSASEINRMISSGRIESAPAVKWAVANVTETDSPLFRIGQPVTVRVMAYPDREFKGRISRIYATVDSNTHRVTIRCETSDPKDELRAGMLASVAIRIQDPVSAVALPANGVVRESDGTMTAWVTADHHRFVQRSLRLGVQIDGHYQILDGLRREELAVTDGAVFLSNMLNSPQGD